jgi:prepilin-type N-terminal cleavage/methylation domain-containing protein
MKSRCGYTLIELLVVLLVMGAMTSLALPLYLSAARNSRHQTANANAKSILQAVQSLYIRAGGKAYNASNIDATALAVELGGRIPLNPCTGGSDLSNDFGLQLTATGAKVKPEAGDKCTPELLYELRLGE